MSVNPTCACGTVPKLIFPCSGGSDVGALSDLAARQMTRDGSGKMYCLAGIGGRISGILASTQNAAGILVIDGCPLNCARKTLEQAGFFRVCAHLPGGPWLSERSIACRSGKCRQDRPNYRTQDARMNGHGVP